MWIYGFHPVREALRSDPRRLDHVLLARWRSDARATEIATLCADLEVPCVEVDEEEISRLLGEPDDGAVHNGFAAKLAVTAAEGASTDADAGDALVVLAEDVQDPRNLGALIRVCDAAGVEQLMVRDRGSAQITAAVVKTSSGAAEWLDIERVTNTANEIERLKRDGYWVYGAAEGGLAPWEVDLSGKVAICVGGEERGLRQRTRKLCDELIGLPMLGRVGSLNLSTAAAAILYEIVRQRASSSGE